ncbi:MAG: hypothetical protein HY650_05385 [Acidobacteria bacterium]|nr:hypothetical protein [Acidobacteriota bacterium]
MTMRRVTLLPLIFGCLSVANPPLRAQEIVAPSARTLFNRATLVRSFVEVRDASFRADGESVKVSQYVPVLALVYGFYPKWMVIVAQPYVKVGVTSRTGNDERHENLNGLGDTQLFVQYDGLYSRNTPGGLTRLSGVFGLQVPTGARRFSTGAVGYTGGLIFQKAMNLKYVFTGDFEYTFATENNRGISTGDLARFNAVPAFFVIPRDPASPSASWLRKLYDRAFRNGAYLILEFNGTWHGQARNRGREVFHTGGTTLSVSPGIQYFLSRRFLVEFSSPVPAVSVLNGKQPEPNSTYVFGFRYLF